MERIRSHHKRLENNYVDQEIAKFRKSLVTPKKTEFVVRLNNYQSNSEAESAREYRPKKDCDSNVSPEPGGLNGDIEEEPNYVSKYECFIGNDIEHGKSEPLPEYVFNDQQTTETFDQPYDDLLEFYKTRTAAIEAKGLREVPSELIDPFDEMVDPKKVVRFVDCIREKQIVDDESDSEDSFVASQTSSNCLSDPVSSENYEPKIAPPLQLIGKHIDVPDEVKQRNKPFQSIDSNQSSSKTDDNLPVLFVTKIDTESLHRSATSMTVTMVPRPEVSTAKNEIIAELFCPNQTDKSSLATKDLLHRYFQCWLQHTTAQKVSGDNEGRDEKRQLKINKFLQNIRQEKQRQCTTHQNDIKNDHEPTAPSNSVLKKTLNSK